MAKKDTYLALLRRGIDETTSQLLSESGLKIGDLKKLDEEKLVNNYGIKKEIAKSVLESVKSGPRASSRQRFIADVITKGGKPKKVDKIQEQRFKREQKDLLQQLNEKREEQRIARVESFRNKKLVMNRLGKTVELIVKLETIYDEEAKSEQRSKLKDQLETRGLEAARDHEMLELDGTPQDIVDFRRKIAPVLCLHACPHCGDEMDPRGSSVIEDIRDYKFVCWECEEEFHVDLATTIAERLEDSETWVKIDPKRGPRDPVVSPPSKASADAIADLMIQEIEATGAAATEIIASTEASNISGTLMSIDDWIDQKLSAKGYIQAQEHREDFIIATGAGATKFNKWMKKAGLYFNKQSGKWTRWEDR